MPHLHICQDIRSGKSNEPIAVLTKLGWVVYGGKSYLPKVMNNRISCEEVSLLNTVERFWEIETYGTKENDSSLLLMQDQRAIRILEETVSKEKDKYKVGLLWKNDNVELPYNRIVAMNRFNSLEKKFKRDPDIENKYKEIIKDYIKKGHATKLK